jgi:membrane protease YdiL (CAAX protease family)
MRRMNPSTSREPIIVREAGWTVILLVLLATYGVITAIALPGVVEFMSSLGEGIVNLIIFVSIFLVAIVGIAFLCGGLRPRDVGLHSNRLAEAIIVVVATWIVIQGAHVVAALLDGDSIQWDSAWQRFGVTDRLMWLAVMVLGTALTEETVFRGFLFPQIHLKCGGSQRTRFWIAALTAALLFGLLHVPRHIVLADMTGLALSARTAAHAIGGLIATILYVRTRNLWVVIGLHGLDNAPTRLVSSPMPSEPVLLLAEIALLVLWPWLAGRPTHRGLAPVISEHDARPTDSIVM